MNLKVWIQNGGLWEHVQIHKYEPPTIDKLVFKVFWKIILLLQLQNLIIFSIVGQ